MTDEQRQICRAVVDAYEVIAPVERKARITDLLTGVVAVVSLSFFAVASYGVTGWWAVAYVVLAGTLGFFYRGMFSAVLNRRRAYRSLASVYEMASLELQLDDD